MQHKDAQAGQGRLPVKICFLRGEACPYRSADGVSRLEPATEYSAGVDLRACLEEPVRIGPGERAKIGTGVAVQPTQPGVAGFVFSRSGLGAKHGLAVAQGVGVIDPDYRGEIIVFLLNTSQEERVVEPGDRIAQLIFLPYFAAWYEPCACLDGTERGAGGFGHTGAR